MRRWLGRRSRCWGWVAAYETRTGDLSRSGHSALFAAYAGPKRHVREELAPASAVQGRRA